MPNFSPSVVQCLDQWNGVIGLGESIIDISLRGFSSCNRKIQNGSSAALEAVLTVDICPHQLPNVLLCEWLWHTSEINLSGQTEEIKNYEIQNSKQGLAMPFIQCWCRRARMSGSVIGYELCRKLDRPDGLAEEIRQFMRWNSQIGLAWSCMMGWVLISARCLSTCGSS